MGGRGRAAGTRGSTAEEGLLEALLAGTHLVVPDEVGEQQLAPGDRVLLYTDGVVEARSAGGAFVGVDGLVRTIAAASDDDRPPPETMRRLMHAILDHHEGELQDDATVVMIEWRGPGVESLKVP